MTPARRRQAGWLAMGIVLTMMWLALKFGGVSEWQPALLAGTITCVLLQRCFVSSISRSQVAAVVGMTVVLVGVLLFVRIALTGGADENAEPVFGGAWHLWVAALLMHTGALMTLIRHQWATR
jgi:hypothetical protein